MSIIKKPNKSQKMFAIIIIVLFFISVITAITLNYRQAVAFITDREFIDLPRISVTVKDSSNKQHLIEATLSVEVARDSAKKIDKQKLASILENTLTTIDYDLLQQKNSTEYIKSVLRQRLDEYLPEDAEGEIYIADLGIDWPSSDSSSGGNSGKPVSNFDKLFKNSNR